MKEREQLTSVVCALKRGEEGAPAELYKAFSGELYTYFLSAVNDSDQAMELMQDTFLEILDTIDSLDEADSFETWSKQIADRRCVALIQNRRDGKTEIISGVNHDSEKKIPTRQVKRRYRFKAFKSFLGKLMIGIVIAVMVACVKEVVSNFQSANKIQNGEIKETFCETGIATQESTKTAEEESTEGETTEEESTEEESTGTVTTEADTEPETTPAETIDIPEVGTTVTVGDFQLIWRGTYYEVIEVSEMPEYVAYIPSEYEGLPVTSIGERVFEANYIGHIIVPKSITHIDATAFRRCGGSEIVIVEEENPVYHSVGTDCLIETATGTILHGRWIIPANAGVRHIGDYAYSGQSSNDLVIPEGVISVGEHAFEYANRMQTLTIPISVTLIKKEALIGCSSLRTINYSGTMAQWEAIEKGADWDKYTGAYVIRCTDGDI